MQTEHTLLCNNFPSRYYFSFLFPSLSLSVSFLSPCLRLLFFPQLRERVNTIPNFSYFRICPLILDPFASNASCWLAASLDGVSLSVNIQRYPRKLVKWSNESIILKISYLNLLFLFWDRESVLIFFQCNRWLSHKRLYLIISKIINFYQMSSYYIFFSTNSFIIYFFISIF